MSEINRREFLRKIGLGAAGVVAGVFGVEMLRKRGRNEDKNKKADVNNSEKFEEENSGKSVKPEMKDKGEDFAAQGETIHQEFLQAIAELPPAEQEKLKKEWDRIAQKEKIKMYERRFSNSDEQLRRFFKHLIDRKDYKKQLAELVKKYCAEYGAPADIVWGVIGVESGGDNDAVSNSKPEARGILQLLPAAAREMGLQVDEEKDERKEIGKNIKAGISYLAKMKERFGSWGLALIAFCEGPTKFSGQLRELEVSDEKKTIVHLYSKEFYGRGVTHPFQYPFYVNAMSKQMLEIMNEGRILPIEKKREEKDEDFDGEKTKNVVRLA